MIVSFVFLVIGIGAAVLVSYMIFFDWYEKKRNRETKLWQDSVLFTG